MWGQNQVKLDDVEAPCSQENSLKKLTKERFNGLPNQIIIYTIKNNMWQHMPYGTGNLVEQWVEDQEKQGETIPGWGSPLNRPST